MPPFNRKQVACWCLYDFANSTYSAVIAAVVFPVYYTSHVVGNHGGEGDLWWGRAISLSMLLVALCSPLLGGLVDYRGARKRFLMGFTLLSVTSVAAFGLLEKGMLLEGFILIVLANAGMEGAFVFYNSYLPIIAPPRYLGRVSAWGFGVGYAGSILSLLLAVPLVRGGHYSSVWLMVSGLFALFSLPAFIALPKDRRPKDQRIEAQGSAALDGWRHTARTFRAIFADRNARGFLISYLIYEDGVATVIAFSSVFAATTLGFGQVELIGLYIVVQGSALVGSFSMARPMDAWGPKRVVFVSLVLWSAVSVMGYFTYEKSHFFAVAAVAGLALGTVQAASRALYARFVPEGRESEYFGAYALVGKSSAVVGPLVFGYVSSSLGSQRPAVLSVAVFFIVGMALLIRVNEGQSAQGPG